MKAAAILCLLCFTLVKSQDQTLSELLAPFMGQIRSEVNNLYVRADTNNNGHFDLDDLRSVFEEYDINKNHEVTRDEFVQHFAGNSSTLRIVALGLFLDMDSDKNGMLEQNDATTYFNKIDTDDDGEVNREEFVSFFTQLFEQLFLIQIIVSHGGLTTTHAP
ncbi:uncharacterized protein LOC112576062 isoform X2 [Pomacea canaliculata]|nr:uncharacterized protein LOC112576062 isoform X2 [Pomacea canaliculata]